MPKHDQRISTASGCATASQLFDPRGVTRDPASARRIERAGVRSSDPPMRKTLFLALLLCAPLAFAQSILTIAGGGTDEGQLATAIPTRGPHGLATDKAGNLYFTETSGRVRR